MITTFDILPSVEYIYNIDKMIPFTDMETKELNVKIISKSIYAAQIVKVLQGDPIFVGILGGFAGKYTKHHMDKSKVKSDIVWMDTETPHKISILDQDKSRPTSIIKNPYKINEKDIIKLEQKIKTHIKRTTTLVLEGECLEGVSYNIYTRLVEEAKKYNVKTIINTGEKEILDNIVDKVPYSFIFTIDELEKIGIDTDSIENIVGQLAPYLAKGVHYIGVDLQNKGGLLLSKNKLCYMEPTIESQNPYTPKCSAAFLGAFAVGVDRKYEQEKIAKLAMAASLGAQESLGVYTKNSIDKLVKKVKVRELPKTLLNPIQNKYLRLRMKRNTI